jgi:AcrR family transcriptional regulator
MRGKIPKRSLAKREKLLEIAAKLFLEKGYEGVSVDEITSQVGGSKTNIYSHFGGKEGLFLALVGLPVNWVAADILRIEDGILVELGCDSIGKTSQTGRVIVQV